MHIVMDEKAAGVGGSCVFEYNLLLPVISCFRLDCSINQWDYSQQVQKCIYPQHPYEVSTVLWMVLAALLTL